MLLLHSRKERLESGKEKTTIKSIDISKADVIEAVYLDRSDKIQLIFHIGGEEYVISHAGCFDEEKVTELITCLYQLKDEKLVLEFEKILAELEGGLNVKLCENPA